MMARKRGPLNEKHRRILAFIDEYTTENGFPPSIREIQEAADLSSTSVVKYHLERLEEAGYLNREANVSRGLRLTDRAEELLGEIAERAQRAREALEDMVRLPIIGRIVASQPVPIPETDFTYFDDETTVEVARSMLPPNFNPQDYFALEVEGESMIDAMVNDGDIVILRRTEGRPRNGEMVAVWLNDKNETTLKYFYLDERTGQVRLEPANPTMQPIYIEDPTTVEVRGKVVMVIRQIEHPLAV